MAVNPGSKAAVQVIKNASTAPVVYFDGAPVYGHWQGNVEVTLTARSVGLKSDNTVSIDCAAVAQLRCCAQAAANLRDALDKALAMLSSQSDEQPKH